MFKNLAAALTMIFIFSVFVFACSEQFMTYATKALSCPLPFLFFPDVTPFLLYLYQCLHFLFHPYIFSQPLHILLSVLILLFESQLPFSGFHSPHMLLYGPLHNYNTLL